MLWVLKTYATNYGLENIYNFTLKIFVYLNPIYFCFHMIPVITIDSNTKWKIVCILISWHLKMPADQDAHIFKIKG